MVFVFFRIFFLIATLFFFMREYDFKIDNVYPAHYIIFLLAFVIYLADYVYSFYINCRRICENRKSVNIFGFFSLILFTAIILSLLYNNNPEDLVKTSAVIILFIIIKYSCNINSRYNL